MEYRITKEQLGNDWLYRTLIALSKCMETHGLPLYVVGATARDLSMTLLDNDASKRRTKDLDVAIAIDNWEEFDDISKTLQENNFERYGTTQKFYYKGEKEDIDYEVDVVPFGGVAVDEKICWPPEGNPVMSVKCFRDVMDKAVSVNIDDAVNVHIAPLCGQFLIKLDTWNDRNTLTDKDAEDMVFIMKEYHDIQLLSNDRTPPDAVIYDDSDSRSDTMIWGAQWLAYDICQLLTTEHLQYYVDMITGEILKGDDSNLIHHFMKHYYGYVEYNPSCHEQCRRIWSVVKEVFSKELQHRTRNES